MECFQQNQIQGTISWNSKIQCKEKKCNRKYRKKAKMMTTKWKNVYDSKNDIIMK